MIGIDLVKTSRMRSFIDRFGDKALNKFLSANEIVLIKNHKTAAGFWAAKEAFSKALGVGIGSECSFKDIEIYKTQNGAPKIRASQKILTNFNISDISLSITHDGEYAIAVVAIESSAPDKIKQL
ncbi:MAG: holo-[acyl-carrier protein] synthase [Campylobacterota bacterium]|nr:holo-[acyl-carrier protein] synthase [Campylobacterota bacterium]